MTLVNDIDYGVGIGAVRDLLARNGIEPADVGQLHRIKDIKLFQQGAKVDQFDADGKVIGQTLETHDLASIILSPKWETGPEWPVVTPGPQIKLKTSTVRVAPVIKSDFSKCVVWPDMQIGYFHGKSGLVSTHDEKAIDLALAITQRINPALVVLVGDNLDAPEFGKYRLSPAFRGTMQAAIDYVTELMFRIHAAAPRARIIWLAGNHEERISNLLLDNAVAAFGLRQGNVPEGWPVLSVPHLCRLDESGVEYIAGYPAGKFWINERLKVIHGTRVKSSGSTAHIYLGQEKTSTLYGHIHRREWAEQTFDKWDGPKTIMAASPGCLAKVTGEVPSTKGAIDLHGRPLTIVEDWQQGIGVVTYEQAGEHRFFYEQVPFHGGLAMYHGKLYGKV